MQQLTKSLGSFGWAMSLFGLQQMSKALGATSSDQGATNVVNALDDVTRVSLEHVGTAVRETFDVGDKMQRGLIDMMFRLVPIGSAERIARSCSCMNATRATRSDGNMAGSMGRTTQPQVTPADELGWGPVPSVA
jgi:hypothetical protein